MTIFFLQAQLLSEDFIITGTVQEIPILRYYILMFYLSPVELFTYTLSAKSRIFSSHKRIIIN